MAKDAAHYFLNAFITAAIAGAVVLIGNNKLFAEQIENMDRVINAHAARDEQVYREITTLLNDVNSSVIEHKVTLRLMREGNNNGAR